MLVIGQCKRKDKGQLTCHACVSGQGMIEFFLVNTYNRCLVTFSSFLYHSYDYRPNWTPLSSFTIINWAANDQWRSKFYHCVDGKFHMLLHV